MSKAWEQKPKGRRPAEKLERRRILIVCEDSKSACDYFKAFDVDASRAEVIPVGTGMNTDSLVIEAIRLKGEATKAGTPYNEVWCVFDRDSFPPENYNNAFQLAHANGIKVAWANQAFELWYLLHFNYHDTGLHRDVYKEKLKSCGIEYDKADTSIYEKLKPHQAKALKFASKLEQYWNELEERSPHVQNPSTSVHKLVQFLNELADLGSVD